MTDLMAGYTWLFGGMMLIMVAMFGAFTMTLKEQRNEARRERDTLLAERARFLSPGADLAQRIGWRRRRLMNRPEFLLYLVLDRIVTQSGTGHRLFTQVAFAAFLETTARSDLEEIRKAAFHSVGRKIADFLIIDRYGNPIAVIEYQGAGHYRGNAHDRDQAKRVACQRACIPLIEVGARGLTCGQRTDLIGLMRPGTAIAAE